jgi:hypothetical protein
MSVAHNISKQGITNHMRWALKRFTKKGKTANCKTLAKIMPPWGKLATFSLFEDYYHSSF